MWSRVSLERNKRGFYVHVASGSWSFWVSGAGGSAVVDFENARVLLMNLAIALRPSAVPRMWGSDRDLDAARR